jgi:hypothetical protein
MPTEYFVYAVLLSGFIVFGLNFIKRISEVNIFYKRLQDMLYFYYKKYPRTSNNYFDGIVMQKSEAIMMFWVSDFNNFILDGDLMEILFKGAKQYVQENRKTNVAFETEDGDMEIDFSLDPEGEPSCPWCDNINIDRFQWMEFEEEDDKGTIQCCECGATTPIGTYDECIGMIKETQEI